jgi:nucleotide-binding universal stress UspA family protein
MRFAAELARAAPASLRMLGVVEPVQLGDVTYRPAAEEPDARFSREAMEEELDRLIETLPSEVGAQKVLVSGSPAEILVSKGRRALDLMVTGTRGYGRLLRFLIGSVSSDVVRMAPWPVIVVPPTARIELAQRGGERAHRQQLVRSLIKAVNEGAKG